MTVKRCSNRRRKNCDLLRGLNDATFPVEVPAAGKIGVVGNFGQEVRVQVGSSCLRGLVKLRTRSASQLGVEDEREYAFDRVDELVRGLNGVSPEPVIIKVIRCAEFGGSRVVVTDANAGVLVVTQREIRWRGRNSNPVRCLQSPGLAAQELPLPALQVQPVKAQTVGVTVRGHKHVAGIGAVEIKFNVTGDVVLAVLGGGLQV